MEQVFNEDGSPLNMNKIELLSNRGSEFIVYKYIDSVIKIYKKDYQLPHLSLEELDTLKNILTQRILLPTGTLWNGRHELIGYKMPFIAGEKSVECDSVGIFFEELEVLKHDLDLLCSNSIILRDVNLSNTIYNGHIYLIDPGNYLIDELDKIILNTEILNTHFTNSSILEELKIIMEDDYSRIKILIDSLSLEERQNLLRGWNYNKINKLIDMLLFARKNNIDSFKYRQIVQFIMRERDKNGFIYNLEVLKMVFNKDSCIGEAIYDFVKRYIEDDPTERKLFFSLYNR